MEEKEELTLENVPKAVNYLINEIAEMRVILEHIESLLGLGVDKHRPIGIEKDSEFFGETERAIKKMVRNQEIHHYSRVRKIYIIEDDIIN